MQINLTEKCADALALAEARYILANEYLHASVARFERLPNVDTAFAVTKAKQLWWLATVNRNFN